MTVRAFQPRKHDPPQFVAEDLDALEEMVGEYVSGEQCDGCGNSNYQVRARTLTPDCEHHTFVCVCTNNPLDGEEYQHPEPCGTSYPIGMWEEDLVCF